MSDSMDLGLLKKSINDLRDSIWSNTQIVAEYTNAINMSNLLKMIELGMVSKKDIMESSFYDGYINNLISSDKTKKKSLF